MAYFLFEWQCRAIRVIMGDQHLGSLRADFDTADRPDMCSVGVTFPGSFGNAGNRSENGYRCLSGGFETW